MPKHIYASSHLDLQVVPLGAPRREVECDFCYAPSGRHGRYPDLDRSVISSTYGRVDVYNDALGASQVLSITLALAYDVVAWM